MGVISKAITAFLTSLVAMLAAFGINVPEAFTAEVIGQIVLAAATIAGMVWGVPNTVDGKQVDQSKANEGGSLILIALICLAFLAGCSTFERPPVNSVSDAIVVTAADIETVARETAQLCQNTVANGPCAPGALISTDTKDQIKASLQDAQDALVVANRSLAANNAAQAGSSLERAEAILRVIRAALTDISGT